MKALLITLSVLLGCAIIAEYGWLESIGISPRATRHVQTAAEISPASPVIEPKRDQAVLPDSDPSRNGDQTAED